MKSCHDVIKWPLLKMTFAGTVSTIHKHTVVDHREQDCIPDMYLDKIFTFFGPESLTMQADPALREQEHVQLLLTWPRNLAQFEFSLSSAGICL